MSEIQKDDYLRACEELRLYGYLRACEALRLRRAGMTFKAIAEQLGNVSVGRARQLVIKGERIERHPEHYR